MPCNECPDSLEVNPNDGCLDPITSDCITYTGPAIPCLTITTGSSLETVIDLLSDAICTLQDEQFTWNCNLLSTCSINSLSDVVTTTPEVGQYLTWNGSNWVNTTLSIPDTFECSDLNSCDISNLGNVNAANPNEEDVLTWNSETDQWAAQSFQCSNLSGCNLDAFGDVNVPTPAEGDVLIFNGYQGLNSNLDSLIESYIFPTINSINQQLDYLTSHLYDCCETTTPSGNSFLGTEAQLCTEPAQGRITFNITYDGIVGITDIDILQKALIVPTATPNQVISITNSNMIVPHVGDMRAEIANISNLNNKLRILVQYKESAIVKQGYLYFDLPHFQLTDNFCVDAVPSIFESLYVL